MYFCNIIILFTVSFSSHGSLPVVDTNQMVKDIQGATYTLNAVDELLSELSVSADDLKEIHMLVSTLNTLKEEIRLYQYMYDEAKGISETRLRRGQILADHLFQIAAVIRRFKRLLSLATTAFGKPEAVTAALSMLREEREKAQMQFDAKLKAQKELEEIEDLRQEMRSKIATKKAMDKEFEEIIISNLPSNIKPINYKDKRSFNKKPDFDEGTELW